MNGTLVIDASIAIKWVVEEEGTAEALALRNAAHMIGPDLLVGECANVLWKKVQRDQLSVEQALLAARLLEGAEIELLPTRALLSTATRIAIECNHPAYDCLYLALAMANDCRFVTADDSFMRKLARRRALRSRVVSLARLPADLQPRLR
jgi:predicted nucleic acid-binding protein